jgi:hypothetical protein
MKSEFNRPLNFTALKHQTLHFVHQHLIEVQQRVIK